LVVIFLVVVTSGGGGGVRLSGSGGDDDDGDDMIMVVAVVPFEIFLSQNTPLFLFSCHCCADTFKTTALCLTRGQRRTD